MLGKSKSSDKLSKIVSSIIGFSIVLGSSIISLKGSILFSWGTSIYLSNAVPKTSSSEKIHLQLDLD